MAYIKSYVFAAEDDVQDVYEEVFSMAGTWRKIARSLRLSSSTTQLISSQCTNDPEECLFNTLDRWLKGMYNTEKYGKPSWYMLVKAVANPAGGANISLAESIAQKYPRK